MSEAANKQRGHNREFIRFHLDEHVDRAIAAALHSYGCDVTTTIKAGLRTLDDNAQMEYVRAERRVIVTHDADFLRLAERFKDHPGIAYCHQGARSTGEIIRALILIYEVMTPEDMTGQVEYL